ncbi:hypothetical protein OAM67_00515 [bacterium]|nr:hypothetical protein [bacterium]
MLLCFLKLLEDVASVYHYKNHMTQNVLGFLPNELRHKLCWLSQTSTVIPYICHALIVASVAFLSVFSALYPQPFFQRTYWLHVDAEQLEALGNSYVWKKYQQAMKVCQQTTNKSTS